MAGLSRSLSPALALALALLGVVSDGVQAASAPKKMPSYVRLCSAKDPQLNACALENGRAALPFFVKGDASLRITPLDPLLIPEVQVEQGRPPLRMTSRNVNIIGLTQANLLDVNIDLKNQRYEATCEVPRLEMVGDYEVSGQILVLPVRGSGKSNFTFENAILHYVQPYTLETKNGYQYMRTSPSKATFNCTHAYFNLDNLFNGDETLGKTVNAYLNENWRTVVDDLSDPFVETAATVIRSFVDAVVENVPFENIFLDTK